MIDIAYYMQFINAILSPCNRWDNVQKKRLKTEAIKKLRSLEYSCNTAEERQREKERGWGWGAKAKSDQRIRKNDITHDPYTRENEDVGGGGAKKRRCYRDPNRDVHLHTGHLQK